MILVTGGGTGGHLYPGLAVARALAEAGQPVTYVGARGGLEERVLPESGLPYRIIPAGKLSRDALRPAEGFKVLGGLWEAWRTVRELRPRAVFSTGGYAGFPAAFVGSLLGVPLLVLEANHKLGLAARMLAGRASRLLLSTPFAVSPALQAKTRTVGLPVREVRVARQEARRRLELDPDRPTVLVLGGSQGSKELNDNLPERLYPILGEWQVLHQVGARWENEMQPKARPHYHLRGYLDTTLAWGAADFAVTRGGAGTLAEVAFHRVPTLGVPLPAALDDGAQAANVGYYAASGGARLLASWDEFPGHLNALLQPSTRQQMSARLGQLSPEGATGRMVEAILEVIR